MYKKCTNCRLVNYPDAANCVRCEADLVRTASFAGKSGHFSGIFLRALVCLCVSVAAVLGFYFSLVVSAAPLNIDQKYKVRQGIRVLSEKGFSTEALLLGNFTVYRSDDNWLNASVAKENAYAATNFPFEIMTLYSDFFTYPMDDTERAAILLHEARHLKGEDEPEAYAFVWKNREKLGWTKDKYLHSNVWVNIRRQTREIVPDLFTCADKESGDCTEQ
ncbi:MAG: hypothetical protein WBO10_11125 [Pyrinomonadaceae bacterium]